MNLLLNKIKSEKTNKNTKFDNTKQLEILLVKIKIVYKPNKLQSVLKELNKIQVIDEKIQD